MSAVRRLWAWCVASEGSTRSSGLLRIGLAICVWTRWAEELLLYFDLSARGLALAVSFYVSSTLMLIGWRSRASSLATGAVTLAMYHWFGLELGREPWTHHHTYLLASATFLCGLTPCGRSYSLDRWLAVRRAERRGEAAPAEHANLWGLRLVALQLSTVYLLTAWDKTNAAFLSGDRLEAIFLWMYFGSELPRAGWFGAAVDVAAVCTVLLEWMLGIGLLVPRFRRFLVVPGLLLHALFYVLLPVATYTVTVFCMYLAYLDADAVHRVLDRLQGHGLSPAPAGGGSP
jgi:uncharacterized membrane protein YidH (DUF202 family)